MNVTNVLDTICRCPASKTAASEKAAESRADSALRTFADWLALSEKQQATDSIISTAIPYSVMSSQYPSTYGVSNMDPFGSSLLYAALGDSQLANPLLLSSMMRYPRLP